MTAAAAAAAVLDAGRALLRAIEDLRSAEDAGRPPELLDALADVMADAEARLDAELAEAGLSAVVVEGRILGRLGASLDSGLGSILSTTIALELGRVAGLDVVRQDD